MCEGVLWTMWTHLGTARTTSNTIILEVAASKFQEIVSAFPTDHARIYATEFVELQNGKLEENTLTDIGSKLDANSMIDVAFPLEVMWSSTMAEEHDHRGNNKNMKQGGFLTRSFTKTGKKNSLLES